MDKNQAIEQIFSEYTDALGRVTLYPAHLSNNLEGPKWDSDNCFLWTGRFMNLRDYLVYTEEIECPALHEQYLKAMVLRSIVECSPKKLLYRHPPTQSYLWSKIYDRASLDEYIGTSLMILSSDSIPLTKLALGIHDALKKQNWSMHTSSYATERRKKPKNFIEKVKLFFSGLKAIYKVAKANGKWGGSREMDKVIDDNYILSRLSTIMLPKDRLFVKLAAGKRASIIDWTHHYLNCWFSIRKKKLSGLMLTFDKLLYIDNRVIHKLTMLEMDNKINKYFNMLYKVKKASVKSYIHLWMAKKFDKEMTKEFGEDYMKTIATKYYSENPKHPMIELYINARVGRIEEALAKTTAHMANEFWS